MFAKILGEGAAKVTRTSVTLLKKSDVQKRVVLCTCATNPMVTAHRNRSYYRDYSKQVKPEKKYEEHSASDSDFEILGHRGESLFWRRKMRTFHGILDVNKDGVISYEDIQLLAHRFVDLGHLSEKHTNDFKNVMKNMWEAHWGEITPYNLVTVEQYLEDMYHVLNDKSRIKKAHSFLPYLFKALDKDKTGEISVDEYKLFFECLGHNNEDAVVSFLSIDSNCDGKVNIKEFVQHGRDFFVTEDEERVSKFFWGPLVDH